MGRGQTVHERWAKVKTEAPSEPPCRVRLADYRGPGYIACRLVVAVNANGPTASAPLQPDYIVVDDKGPVLGQFWTLRPNRLYVLVNDRGQGNVGAVVNGALRLLTPAQAAREFLRLRWGGPGASN